MEAPETVATFMEDGTVSVTLVISLGLFRAMKATVSRRQTLNELFS